MKIGIDVRTLQASAKTGLWAYTQSMVEALSRVDKDDDFYLFARGMRYRPDRLPGRFGSNFRKVVIPVPDRRFYRDEFLWHQVALPATCALLGLDLLWQPASHTLPRWGKFRKVITVHDLRTLHIDDFLGQDIPALKRAVKTADAVVCISEFTRQDAIRHLGAEEDKTVVVYNGVTPLPEVCEEEIVRLRERFAIDRDFVFSLGMVPRKNVPNSLKAFARSGLAGSLLLVFAGSHGGFLPQYQRLVEELGIGEWVRFIGAVSDRELAGLFRSARVFLFPSLFEGFGLPVLEAQSVGLPVIASNTSALPEILGDSALLVDPYSVEEIGNAIRRLAYDESLRDELIRKGQENVRRFDWDESAKRLLNLFRSVL